MSTSIPSSTLEKFTNFGDLLRYLRRAAGLTQLELSVQVGYSHAQISRLEQNLRLPDIPTIEARFIPALGIEDQPKVIARLLELAANVRREDAPGLGLCPYKGLNYFDEADADLFVGREMLTAKLAERVLSLAASETGQQTRFLAIVGASGSGKSSLVRAGLIPALRWNPKSSDWQIHILTPTAHPIESLATSLTDENTSVLATATLMDDLSRDPRSLQIFVKRQMPRGNQAHTLLVVDQFEELFALCRSEEERTSFIGNLLAAASESDGPVIVIITLRADFYAHCANYVKLREALAGNQEYIGAMNEEELCRAVEEPARRGRWEFEPGLVELLLHDVGHEPGALPLLSHALFETWQRRRGRTMTLSGYTSSGGVRGAIAETAETVFIDQFTAEQRSIARRIFLRLTELGDESSAADTRRRATFNELILRPEEANTTHSVLKALADARLIITSEDSAEVAHEALIREWPTLRKWLEDNREGLRLHRQLTEAAHEWAALDRTPDIIYRGARLAQAREWAGRHAEELNTLEHEFLVASIEASEREAAERESQRSRELEAAQSLAEAQRQRAELETQRAEEQLRSSEQLRKRALYLAGAFTAALIMALTALFFGAQARQAAVTAQAQQRVAFSRELAAASINNLDVDPELSLLIAQEAVAATYSVDQSWTEEAEDALHRALLASRVELTIRGHTNVVGAVAFSPDGTRFATASDDGTMKVWDAVTGEELLTITTNATGGHHGLAFSPDGARLATAGENGIAKVWDAVTGEELVTLEGHADWISGIVFSPDGTRLATSSEDRTAKIWDAATGQEVLSLRGHAGAVWAVAFSPDGRRLVTAGQDARIKLWDTASGEELFTLSELSGPVTSMSFSPDGKFLATGGGGETAKIWDLATHKNTLTLQGHRAFVASVAYSPDGRRLATASLDGNVKLWDALTGQEMFTLAGHSDAVVSLAFSSDCVSAPHALAGQCGTRLATTSLDGTIKVWNVSSSQELLTLLIPDISQYPHFSGALSPDGTRLAAGLEDGTAKVWDISDALNGDGVTGEEILTLRGHFERVNNVVFSPDDTRLATTSEDNTAKVWDLATGQPLLTLQALGGGPVAFSPDGTRLATSDSDRTVRLWDISTKRDPSLVITTDQALLTLLSTALSPSLAFSPDGAFLAAGGEDGTVRVWDMATGKLSLSLRGHTARSWGTAFSPDRTRLATAGDDGTAIVWDVATGDRLFTLRGHNGYVDHVAFNPDGTRLATAGQDATVRLWDSGTGQELLPLRGHSSEILRLAFSPACSSMPGGKIEQCGTRLFTAGIDGTVRFYLTRIEDLMKLAHTHVTRSLTTEECQRYLHLGLDECSRRYAPLAQLPIAATLLTTLVANPPSAKRKICQVTDETGINDQFFNQKTFEGVQEAAETFGWEKTIVESQQPTNYQNDIRELVQADCDLIAMASFNLADTLKAVAETSPGQKFIALDAFYDPPLNNVRSQTYVVDQAAFLAGYLAASLTQTGKVATFGGFDFPPVTDFMDGFALGVAYYNEKKGTQVEVLGWDASKHDGLFTGDFLSVARGRDIGEELLGQGADIIFPVAGDVGLGTAGVVQERGNAYLIGVDTDWAVTFPEYADIILTSIEKRMDVSVVRAVQAIIEEKFIGGNQIGTLETGEVGLAPFHEFDSLVSEEVKAELEQIKKDIIEGKIQTRP